MEKTIAGIDEAGRGAVIGPMVIAGVAIKPEIEDKFRMLGIRDSKLISPRKRTWLAKQIEKLAKDIIVIKVAACKIDSYKKEGINLNRLEALKFGDILNFLSPDKAFIDCPDVKPQRLKAFLLKITKPKVNLVVENHADKKYPIVGAASIIAKVTRDQAIEDLKKKWGDFGPGYPSNPITINWMKTWLKEHKKFPECVRMSWATTKELEKAKKQSKLGDWFKKLKNQF